MNNDEKLNEMLQLSKKIKSPISLDKARYLIELSDLKYQIQNQFKNKLIGGIMFTSSLIIMIYLISMFNSNNNNLSKNSVINNIKSYSEASNQVRDNEKQLFAVNKEKSKNNIQNKNISNTNTKIDINNSIELNNEELESLGININYDKDMNVESIAYFTNDNGLKSKTEFYGDKSLHYIFDNDDTINIKNYIKIRPFIITNFNGDIRLLTRNYPTDKINLMDKIMNLYDIQLDMSADRNEIDKVTKEHFSKLYDAYKSNKIDEIEKELKNLYQKIKIFEHKVKIYEDTNLTNSQRNIIIYLDKPINDSLIQMIKDFSKKSIKLSFYSKGISFFEFLKENNKDIYQKLVDIKKNVQMDYLTNNLVPIKINFGKPKSDKGIIFWYEPTDEFLSILPKIYQEKLQNELSIIKEEQEICGKQYYIEQPILDIWKKCSINIADLSLFPNPVFNQLNIKFTLNKECNISVAIYDLTGNLIKELDSKDNLIQNEYILSYDISNVSKGMYYLGIKTNKGDYVLEKFIKN